MSSRFVGMLALCILSLLLPSCSRFLAVSVHNPCESPAEVEFSGGEFPPTAEAMEAKNWTFSRTIEPGATTIAEHALSGEWAATSVARIVFAGQPDQYLPVDTTQPEPIALSIPSSMCPEPNTEPKDAVTAGLGPAPRACPIGAPEPSPWPGGGHGDGLSLGPVGVNQFYSIGGPPTLILNGSWTVNGWSADPLVSVLEGNEVTITGKSDGGDVVTFERKGTKATDVLHLAGRRGAPGTSFFNGHVNYDVTLYVPHADCYSLIVTWTGATEGTDSALVAIGSRAE